MSIRFCSRLSTALLAVATLALPACGTDSAQGPAEDSGAPSTDPNPNPGGDASSPSTSTETTPPAPPTPPAGPPPFGAGVGQWSWVDVPGTTCANGEPTGLGVNLGTGSDLLIYLVGGGGCWDEFTCGGLNTAMHIEGGYKKADFEAELQSAPAKQAENGGLFDRNSPINPYRNASFVFIPYCTGDVHSGDATKEFLFPKRTMHFAGRKNIEVYLSRIVPAFQNVSRVTFAGSSAGGFGAALNYWRVQDAFGKTRVDLIDDSGPAVEQKNMPLLPTWKKAWNMDGAFPPGCAECKDNIALIPAYYSRTYPSSRLALLSYDLDNVISVFFVTTQKAFAGYLETMAATRIAPLSNMRYFFAHGSSHVLLGNLMTASGNVSLGNWLTEMATDSPSWSNVNPN